MFHIQYSTIYRSIFGAIAEYLAHKTSNLKTCYHNAAVVHEYIIQRHPRYMYSTSALHVCIPHSFVHEPKQAHYSLGHYSMTTALRNCGSSRLTNSDSIIHRLQHCSSSRSTHSDFIIYQPRHCSTAVAVVQLP